MLQGVARGYRGYRKGYRGLQLFTEVYKGYRGLQGVTRG